MIVRDLETKIDSYTLNGRMDKVVASHDESWKIARSNPGCG